jgi:hypothetical protein
MRCRVHPVGPAAGSPDIIAERHHVPWYAEGSRWRMLLGSKAGYEQELVPERRFD